MLTPRFKISQDRESLTISIYAPFTHLSSTTIHIEDQDLRFFSTPYYLRLHLPGNVVEDKGYYDADSNSFIIRAVKETPGEEFVGLDKITTLLTPSHPERNNINIGSGVQEVDPPTAIEEEDPLSWFYPQEIPLENDDDDDGVALRTMGYGFGFEFSKVYTKLPFSNALMDISDVDLKSNEEITKERLYKEMEDFSNDHYLSDLYDPTDELKLCCSESLSNWLMNEKEFTKKEIERMISLPKKHYLISEDNYHAVYLGLLDILMAYFYDMRITGGEHCSESGWTISKLCATLSCAEKFNKLKKCIGSFFRRSLTYPLFRSYELSILVVKDVCEILKREDPVTPIVKILLDVIPIFNDYDERYIFNQLYIEPYATWIQSRTPLNLNYLGHAIEKTLEKWNKDSVELELTELEEAAGLCCHDEKNGKINDLIENVKKLELNTVLSDSDDDSESDSSTGSSSYESDSSSHESGSCESD